MITRDEFPYLQELLINDAYAVKDRRITVFEPGQPFKHLVLTGRNGSGKTTVLYGLKSHIQAEKLAESESRNLIKRYRGWIASNPQDSRARGEWATELRTLMTLTPTYCMSNRVGGFVNFIPAPDLNYLYSFFPAFRQVSMKSVVSITREDDIEKQLEDKSHSQNPSSLFKQYLVNKKVFQVFDVMDGRQSQALQQELFFKKLEETFREIFNDRKLRLEFERESFEFYLVYSDGRRTTFNELSAGYSAFLSILTDLLLRTDLLRKQANDYTYDPCGFVLIDEPETHLHLEMQYQILPLLTSLFPNLQFIVATHSPAVASSIKNATVYDLSTGETLGDSAAGSSFSELMQTHFGLENEYSNVADAILDEVAAITALPDRAAARERLQKLLNEQGRYMSPVLRLDVQAQLLSLQNDQAA